MKLCSYLLSLSFLAYTSASTGCDVSDPRAKGWAMKLNSNASEKSVREACDIISSIDELIIQAQNVISDIASNTVSYREKIGNDGLIEKIIASAFLNGSVVVQVFHSYTQRHQPPDEIRIRTYLQGLADLTYKGIYGTVSLVYDQENMKLMNISPLDNTGDAFEMEVQAFQEFEACKTVDGKSCYADVTDKRFFVRVTDKNSDEPKIKITRITAIDSWAADYFDRRRATIMGRP